MAITNSITRKTKIPRGYNVQPTKLAQRADGTMPPLEAQAAPYLPVLEREDLLESWFTLKAGTIVAFDKTTLNGETTSRTNQKWLVPANGGSARTVTYTTNDIGETIDIDELDGGSFKVVAAAGAASKQIAANYPAGFLAYNAWSTAAELIYQNFKLQTKNGVLCRGFIELPLEFDTGANTVTQATLETGLLVKPGAFGEVVKWNPATDSVDQICGRATRVDPVEVHDALDKVLTVPGFELPGTGTSGYELHLNTKLYGTSTRVSRKVQLQILLV